MKHLATKQLSLLRGLVQTGFVIFCLWMGYRFYQFYLWAMGKSEIYVPRPPSVEGFLPISALLGLKNFVLSGNYDVFHPAGLTIFVAALTIGVLFRKGFCGWICPVGAVSNFAEYIGLKVRSLFRLPAWLDYPLLALKYLLLAFFCYQILWKMSLKAVQGFMRNPYNMAADAKMLMFFLDPSNLALGIMIFLVVISFFLRNFWCRYLCPYGALLGLLAIGSPCQVNRDARVCIDCKKCDTRCPGSITVSEKNTVCSPECIGCLECVAVCPQKNCLTLSAGRRKHVSPYFLPIAVLGVFFLFWIGAVVTGHWHSQIPDITFKKLYAIISSLNHPSF